MSSNEQVNIYMYTEYIKYGTYVICITLYTSMTLDADL